MQPNADHYADLLQANELDADQTALLTVLSHASRETLPPERDAAIAAALQAAARREQVASRPRQDAAIGARLVMLPVGAAPPSRPRKMGSVVALCAVLLLALTMVVHLQYTVGFNERRTTTSGARLTFNPPSLLQTVPASLPVHFPPAVQIRRFNTAQGHAGPFTIDVVASTSSAVYVLVHRPLPAKNTPARVTNVGLSSVSAHYQSEQGSFACWTSVQRGPTPSRARTLQLCLIRRLPALPARAAQVLVLVDYETLPYAGRLPQVSEAQGIVSLGS